MTEPWGRDVGEGEKIEIFNYCLPSGISVESTESFNYAGQNDKVIEVTSQIQYVRVYYDVKKTCILFLSRDNGQYWGKHLSSIFTRMTRKKKKKLHTAHLCCEDFILSLSDIKRWLCVPLKLWMLDCPDVFIGWSQRDRDFQFEMSFEYSQNNSFKLYWSFSKEYK